MAATRLVRIAIVGVGALSASVAVDVGSAAAQLEVPRVEAPQVELPSVPTAPVSPPALPSPPPVPQVELPQAPAPDVQVPSVPAPSLPGTSAPGGTGDPAAGGVAGSAGGSTGAVPGAAGEAIAGGGASDGGPQGGGQGARAAAASGRRDPNPPVSSRSERSLRREVRELSGCFAALPAFQRRVLDLRTGFGGAPPRSRRRVARGLDVTLRRVRRAEDRGLRGLRTSHEATGCGGGSGLGTVWNGVMASVVAAPALAPLASFEATGGADETVADSPLRKTRAAILGDRESSTDEGLPPAPEGEDLAAGAGDRTAAASIEGGGAPLLLWLLAGLATLAALAFGPGLRRRYAGAGAGAGGAGAARDGHAAPDASADAGQQGMPAVVADPRGWSAPSNATELRDRGASTDPPEAPAPPPATPVPVSRENLPPWASAAAPRGEPAAPRAAGGDGAPRAGAQARPGPDRAATPAARPTTGSSQRKARPAQRALGVAVSSAVSLAVGLAVRARGRSGRRRRR